MNQKQIAICYHGSQTQSVVGRCPAAGHATCSLLLACHGMATEGSSKAIRGSLGVRRAFTGFFLNWRPICRIRSTALREPVGMEDSASGTRLLVPPVRLDANLGGSDRRIVYKSAVGKLTIQSGSSFLANSKFIQ